MGATRRHILTLAPAIGAAGARPAGRPVRLGGPIFIKSDDPRELAREHRRLGYSAAYCPDAKTSDTEKIRAIRDGFDAENVVIAEVGAWKNMLDPDAAARKANLDYVTERLALADAVGARCCVDIAGSYNPKIWYGYGSQESVQTVLRRHGRELPPCHRCDPAHANPLHHRDDAVGAA